MGQTPAERLEKIKQILKEEKELGSSPEEVMMALDDMYPREVETIIVEKPLKITPQKQEYDRQYREWLKIKDKLKSQEDKKLAKINHAKERTYFFCFSCERNIKIQDPLTNTHELVLKKNHKSESIMVLNQCPHCDRKLRAFGGYLA